MLDARFSLNVEGTYSLNLNQQRSSTSTSTRPRASRWPTTAGRCSCSRRSIVPHDRRDRVARRARLAVVRRVSELRSDLESRTAQLSLRLSPITRAPTRFGWSAAYTYSHMREQVLGLQSTAGNPLVIEWARGAQGPHQITYNLRYNFFDAVHGELERLVPLGQRVHADRSPAT